MNFIEKHRAFLVASALFACLQALDLLSTAIGLSVGSGLAEGNAAFLDPVTLAPMWGLMLGAKGAYTAVVMAFSALLGFGLRSDRVGSLPLWYCSVETGRVVFHNFFLVYLAERLLP